jgi:hypothetical protein
MPHLSIRAGASLQGQILRRELEVHALLLVNGDRDLAFDNILIDGSLAVANGEVSRPANRHGFALLVAVDLAVELVLVTAIDKIAHHHLVFEDHHRLFGNDVRGKGSIGHDMLHRAARGGTGTGLSSRRSIGLGLAAFGRQLLLTSGDVFIHRH